MEPSIIDYYNELPNGINVIDKMNLELQELQNKYDEITNKFRIPYKICESVQEYDDYDTKIYIEFKDNLKKILLDKDIGVKAISNSNDSYNEISILRLKRGYKIRFLLDKIIDELDILTENKNKKWCKTRIDTAFDSLDEYEQYDNYEDMIEDIINCIYDNEYGTNYYLPEVYNKLCTDVSFSKNDEYWGDGLHSILNFMKCSKCNKLIKYDKKMLCVKCHK